MVKIIILVIRPTLGGGGGGGRGKLPFSPFSLKIDHIK